MNIWFGLIKTKNVVSSRKCLKEIVPPSSERLTIRYRKDLNIVLAKGQSTSLEVSPVYYSLIDIVKSHLEEKKKLVCYLHYSISYATTPKLLFNLLNVMQDAHKDSKDVTVYWGVEDGDEELMDIGLELKSLIDFKFYITQT